MWPLTDAQRAALSASHGMRVTVDVIGGAQHLLRVPFESGSVAVTARNRVRRRLTLVLAEALFPVGLDDVLSPGAELVVQYALTGADGTPIGPPIPVFTGAVDEPGRVLRSGRSTLTASDHFEDVNAAMFLAPRAGRRGVRIVEEIRALVLEAVPEAGVTDSSGAVDVVPAGIVWLRDRGGAIDELAAAIGAEVIARPDSSFLIRRVPTIADEPVWAIATTDVIDADVSSVSRRGVRNGWVVTGERPDGSSAVLATVLDLDPGSPTRWGGRFRQRPGFWSSQLVTTPGQAAAAARAKLARSRGLTQQVQVSCAPNPALDGGDVVARTVIEASTGLPSTVVCVIDDIDLGLTPSSASMTFTARSAEEPSL